MQSSAVTYHLFALNLSLSRILRSSEVTLQERERGENGGGWEGGREGDGHQYTSQAQGHFSIAIVQYTHDETKLVAHRGERVSWLSICTMPLCCWYAKKEEDEVGTHVRSESDQCPYLSPDQLNTGGTVIQITLKHGVNTLFTGGGREEGKGEGGREVQ